MKTTVMSMVMVAAALSAGAQTTGTVHLQVEPSGYEYVLDHKFRMAKPQLELITGPHHFSFWAPQRAVVDTTLVLEEGKTLNFGLRLPYARDYLVHQRDLQQYRYQRKMHRIVPAVVTGGAMLWAALSYAKAKKAHDLLEADRTAYENGGSPHGIVVLKTGTIPQHKDEFKKANTQFQVAAGITLLCAGATAYLFHRSGKAERPVYEDKEKLRFDGLSWMPGPQGGQIGAGLTWNFGR